MLESITVTVNMLLHIMFPDPSSQSVRCTFIVKLAMAFRFGIILFF